MSRSQADAANLAKYACDSCRSRKIRCSREKPRCAQCTTEARKCIYSRQGVIHRNRKSKLSYERPGSAPYKPSVTDQSAGITPGEFESQLEADIHAAQEDLDAIPLTEGRYSGNLSSLSTEYTSFWQDPSFIDVASKMQAEGGKQYFTFEKQSDEWIKVFELVMQKGIPWFQQVPSDIAKDLAAHPERVRQSAYLVMFYGIILTLAAAEPASYGEDTIHKLRWNLWLALNDAKLLLEPSEVNIQALFLLSMHVQDFHTPSLCWMLSTTACRMLQALGITGRSIDQETKDRRTWLFWVLNSLDLSLALIFGRPPTFHRAMRERMPTPDFNQLLSFQPHLDSTVSGAKKTSLFGAHFMHQLYAVGAIVAEIWSCLYDHPSTHQPVESIKKSLDSWYKDGLKVLEATRLAEQPLLSAKEKRSVDIGISFFSFQYHYHMCVLLRSQKRWRSDCIESSRAALNLLEGLVSDANEVFNGVIWALLYCPFTPFFVLFGNVLAKCNGESKNLSLEAMQCLPTFMEKMSPRHPQAARLYKISSSLVEQARSVLLDKSNPTKTADPQHARTTGSEAQRQQTSASMAKSVVNDSQMSDVFDPYSFANFFNSPPMPEQSNPGTSSVFWTPGSTAVETDLSESTAVGIDMSADGMDLSNMFMQSDFDWFAWDTNGFSADDTWKPF